jgi:hypothetical protein
MPKVKELVVSCATRPGTLAEVARTLGLAEVNILGFQVGTLGSEGKAHFVVDSVPRAKKALSAARISFTEKDVLHIELPHRPGGLGSFAGKLAMKKINIDYGYTTASRKGKFAGVVVGVSAINKAARVR